MLLLKVSLLRSVKSAQKLGKDIELSDDFVYTDNPLRNVDDNSQSATNAVDTQTRVYELQMENADQNNNISDLNIEITDLKRENTILQERIKVFETKNEDKTGEKSADL